MSDSYTLWSPGEREKVKQALFPEGLNYEPDLAIAVKARVDLSKQRIADLERENAKLREERDEWKAKDAKVEQAFANRAKREVQQMDAIYAETEKLRADLAAIKSQRDAYITEARQSADYISKIGRLLGSTCGDDTPDILIERLKADLAAANERAERAEAKAAVIGGEWCTENRAAGRGPCGACSWCCQQAIAQSDALRKALEQATETLRQFKRQDGHNHGCTYDVQGNDPISDICSCEKTVAKALTAAKSALGQKEVVAETHAP